jgi:hypothetical protein
MRKRFDKSPEIDAARNLRLLTMIQNHDEPYTEKEEEILRDGQNQFAVFASQKGKELKMPLPAVKAKLAFKVGDSRAFGFVTTTVRARSMRSAAASVECGGGATAAVNPSSAKKVPPQLLSAKKVLSSAKKAAAAVDRPEVLSQLFSAKRVLPLLSPPLTLSPP